MYRKIFSSCLIIFGASGLFSQETKKIEVRHVDLMKGSGSSDLQRLLGNVVIRHKNLILESDSAYFFPKSNKLKAYSEVYIHQADSVRLYADSVYYDGATELISAFGNVLLENDSLVLTTEELYYNKAQEKGYYPDKGTIRDNVNILKSIEGTYFMADKRFDFVGDVHMYNDQYTIFTDTLHYETTQKVASFYGPTDIIRGSDSAFAHKGRYYSVEGILYTSFLERAIYDKQSLKADSLFYDRFSERGEAWRNVVLKDSTKTTLIRGGYLNFDDRSKKAWVTQEPYMTQTDGTDSLFVHGDSIFAVQQIDSTRMIRIFPDVKIFSEDLQGKSDSVTYRESEGLLRMKGFPVIWMGSSRQLTSDTVLVKMSKHTHQIEEIQMINNAMMIQQNVQDSAAFNQVQGRNMYAYFRDNKLSHIKVDGNAKAVYYIYTQDTINPVLTGINKIVCGSIRIDFSEKKIQKATFFREPDAEVYPPKLLPPSVRRLRGFLWRMGERPETKRHIFDPSIPLEALYPSIRSTNKRRISK